MKKAIAIFAIVTFFATIAPAQEARTKELERVQAAGKVLQEIMAAPDKGIPEEILTGADCVAVIPSMMKGGFVFGGNYGKGVATCRSGARWSAPAPIRVEGGSWGLQIGGEAVDLVMLVMNEQGMRNLLESKFRIGADASAAAGPVGRHVQGETDWKMRAQVLTYSRARGAFAGMTVNGAVLKQDEDDTVALYGKMVPFSQILTGKVQPPVGTTSFLTEVRKYFREAKASESARAAASPSAAAQTKESVAEPQNPPASKTTTSTTEKAESSQDVKSRILKSLQDAKGLSVGDVNVTVTQDTVELTGSVPTESDKATAERIARENAGNRKVVDDNLVVK